jgi:hypothetical protein
LMETLEKQGLFRRYAHQDENKARIDEAARQLDEAIQRFDVSFKTILLSLLADRQLAQTNMQIGVLLKQQRMWGALVELDDLSRDRHGEILGAAQTSSREREVCMPTLSALLVGLARATVAAPDRDCL